jgi:hypothetical protein
MNTALKTALAFVLVLAAATSAGAQAAGNWQNIHGQVQAVQGHRLTLKADDGRVIDVDMQQVSPSVQGAMQPNLGVTVTGFPVTPAERFTARYIVQDNAGPAPAAAVPAPPAPSSASARVQPLVAQFADSKEFRDKTARFHNNERAAQTFVTQLFQGFLDRTPNDQERTYWTRRLLDGGDVRGTVETFLNSGEYLGKNKSDREAIIDLYQAFFGRTPSADEVQIWERQIARR